MRRQPRAGQQFHDALARGARGSEHGIIVGESAMEIKRNFAYTNRVLLENVRQQRPNVQHRRCQAEEPDFLEADTGSARAYLDHCPLVGTFQHCHGQPFAGLRNGGVTDLLSRSTRCWHHNLFELAEESDVELFRLATIPSAPCSAFIRCDIPKEQPYRLSFCVHRHSQLPVLGLGGRTGTGLVGAVDMADLDRPND